ncbi:MAG: undecaprenyl-diphosphate phosphatase [Methanosarcinales archaeon]
MMNLIQAIILGIIQGITEWLPISSEGQSILFMLQYLHINPENVISVAIFLHLGTTIAVSIKFRREFLEILKNLNSKLAKIIIISTFSSAITAIPLFIFLKETFNQGEFATMFIGVMLIATGLVLKFSRRPGNKTLEEITTKDIVTVGLAQGFAILPGISRSGTTIAVLLLSNIEQKLALTISFIMSVPVVLGAIVLDIDSISTIPISNAITMMLVSLVVGYATMDLLLRFAEKVNFSKFCVSLGGITLIYSLLPYLWFLYF